jgi:hypothetical protein
VTSDPERLLAEVARLAGAFHWSLDVLLDLEHHDRRRFLDLVSAEAADASER